jgi:hypothetical protein
MTEAASAQTEAKGNKDDGGAVEVKVGKGLSTATINGTKIEISPEGNVVAFTDKGVQVKPVAIADAAAKKEGTSIDIGKDFNTVAMYGATVELATDGSLIVSTNGKVTVKPAPANDTSVAALLAGSKMADGSIFAGLTADGKQQIYAMPTDLDVTMTFNDAAKAVKKLNSNKALGHDDWQIPALENVRVLYKNQNEGDLKGTFKTAASSGSVFPDWYWSSTEGRGYSSYVHFVRFSDGSEGWCRKDYFRLSCRPVRLVAAQSPSLG